MELDPRTYIEEKSRGWQDTKVRLGECDGVALVREWLKSEINAEFGAKIGIGTGRVIHKFNGKTSPQIDLIIYDKSKVGGNETALQEDSLLIDNKAVLAIVKVERRINPSESSGILGGLIKNKEFICGSDWFNEWRVVEYESPARIFKTTLARHFFAGILVLETQAESEESFVKNLLVGDGGKLKKCIENAIRSNGMLHKIDCIAFGENYFMNLCSDSVLPECDCRKRHYGFYRVEGESFGRFMLKLRERIFLMLSTKRRSKEEWADAPLYEESESCTNAAMSFLDCGLECIVKSYWSGDEASGVANLLREDSR